MGDDADLIEKEEFLIANSLFLLGYNHCREER